MSNIRDAQSSYLKGKLRFEKFIAKKQAQWYGPEVATQLMFMIKNIPPEILAQMDQKKITNVMKQLRGE
jgi:hypothetical protein